MSSYAVELVLQPGEQRAPAAAAVVLRVHGAHGGGRAAHDAHQQLDAGVGALLVVPARARRRLQQPRPLLRHALHALRTRHTRYTYIILNWINYKSNI